MTDLMRAIYDYLLDNHYKEFLPQEYFWHYARLVVEQESALLESLSDSQRQLLERFESTQDKIHLYEMEAIFQAAWSTSRELA